MKISDPITHVRKEVLRLGSEHEAIEADALMSGAMPRDFRIVLVFRRPGLATELR